MPKRKDQDDSSQRAQLESGKGKHLYVVIPSELHKQLKLRAVVEDTSMSAIVTDALATYLDED